MRGKPTAADKVELGAFTRYLSIMHWRMVELGECKAHASIAASMEVYGDSFCRGDKHRKEAANDRGSTEGTSTIN